MITKTVRLQGHILDSLTFSKVLDKILAQGGEYEVVRLVVGEANDDISLAEIAISAKNEEILESILKTIASYGAEVIP